MEIIIITSNPIKRLQTDFFLGTLIYKFSFNYSIAAMSVWVQIHGNECHLINQVMKLMLWGIRKLFKIYLITYI